MDNNQFKNLEDFSEGNRVDISDIAEMQNVVINRIALSGVTISGPGIRDYTVVSCHSPARLSIDRPKAAEIILESGNLVEKPTRKNKGAVVAYNYPPDSFTIKNFMALNNIGYPIAYLHIKETCEVVGDAPKPVGQRGKSAKLFQFKKSN